MKMSVLKGSEAQTRPGSTRTPASRGSTRQIIGYAYYNHRLIGPVKTERAAMRHFAKWEDLIDLMDLRAFMGEDLDMTYSIHPEEDLGHLGPSENFDAFEGARE